MSLSFNPQTPAIHFGAVSNHKKDLNNPTFVYVTEEEVRAAGLQPDILEKSSLIKNKYVVYADGDDAVTLNRALDNCTRPHPAGLVNSKTIAENTDRRGKWEQARQDILNKLAQQLS